MTKLVVATSEGVRLRRDIAGAGSRFAAGLLDGMILSIGYFAVILLFVALNLLGAGADGISGFILGLLVGGTILLVLAYHVVFHALDSGRTPGKRALGIRVLSADGRSASLLQYLLRAFVWPIDVALLLPAPLGLVLVAATSKHQRLGDLVAGTLVVRDSLAPQGSEPRGEPFPRETWSGLRTRTLALTPGMAARLGSRDREVLRELLSRTELSGEQRRRLFVAAARHYCGRLGLGRFADARDVVRELYLFARENAPDS